MNVSKEFDEWKVAQECVHLLNTGQKTKAYEKIIEMLDYISKNGTKYGMLWGTILESAGFFPYLDKYKDIFKNDDVASMITKEYFASDNMENIYFHKEQKALVNKLKLGKNLIVSAPTSFGKSLLIEEVVSSQKYKNIIIIQPTLALLDESRKKLVRYNKYYKLIVHTSQEPDAERGNIFLYTAERVLEYQKFPNIDFFILDEFYKLSKKRDDERADLLNNAFHNVLREHHCGFMLLGPNIDNISPGFANKYNAEFYKSDYSLVLNKSINVYQEYAGQFGASGKKQEFKQKVLFELLSNMEEKPTIIFCSSPARVRMLSRRYVDYLKTEKGKSGNQELPLSEWIDVNVSKDWDLKELLSYSVGIHDGALPKHITSSIINYMANGKINCLFCTSTIIEGVNTCAQNIIYFDKTKGNKVDIDYFDYCNIKGRAGRMMMHFIGNIYNFNEPPEPEQTVVDIPFYEQENISDEILINLNYDEMKYPEKEQNQYILNLPPRVKNIFKKNGVSVKGQENIVNELMKDENYNLINWSGKPTYEQLSFVLSLAWDNLIRAGETTNPMTQAKLVKLTFDYGNGASIKEMIASEYKYKIKGKTLGFEERKRVLNEVIQTTFQIFRHWFQYKVPKWISVINTLQEYVCEVKEKNSGNYLYYASIIENGTVPANAAILLEYNIPASTINKLVDVIPKDITEQSLVDYIFEKELYKRNNLIKYERELLLQNLFSEKKV